MLQSGNANMSAIQSELAHWRPGGCPDSIPDRQISGGYHMRQNVHASQMGGVETSRRAHAVCRDGEPRALSGLLCRTSDAHPFDDAIRKLVTHGYEPPRRKARRLVKR